MKTFAYDLIVESCVEKVAGCEQQTSCQLACLKFNSNSNRFVKK